MSTKDTKALKSTLLEGGRLFVSAGLAAGITALTEWVTTLDPNIWWVGFLGLIIRLADRYLYKSGAVEKGLLRF